MRDDYSQIVEVLKKHPPGLSCKEVALNLEISEKTAQKRLAIAEAYKLIKRRKIGSGILNYA